MYNNRLALAFFSWIAADKGKIGTRRLVEGGAAAVGFGSVHSFGARDHQGGYGGQDLVRLFKEAF